MDSKPGIPVEAETKIKQLGAEIDYWVTLINTVGPDAAKTVTAPRLKTMERDDLVTMVGIGVLALAGVRKELPALGDVVAELATEAGCNPAEIAELRAAFAGVA